jgi:HisA/HisF family protein
MRVIPVIDLMHGQVVRGVAGNRSQYRPIESHIASDARPATIARSLVESFGFKIVYVADLDAIQGGSPNLHAWEEISRAGLSLWIDAGVGDPAACLAVAERLSSLTTEAHIIIGLESLRDPDDDGWKNALSCSPDSIFSLDLKNGVPIHRIHAWRDCSPVEIALSARALGFSKMIVLDLADVGTSQGTRTLALCGQLAQELPSMNIIAGGGVRGMDDLHALSSAGCCAALVASALHDGRLTAEDIRQCENAPH